jgi:hypothetical protein
MGLQSPSRGPESVYLRKIGEEMWNRWDFALADELIAEGVAFRCSLGVSVQGRERFKEYVRAVRRALPDLRAPPRGEPSLLG